MGLDSPYHVIVASPNPALDSYYLLSELSIGNVNRADEVLHAAGGKGINLARAAIALGGKVLSLSILGGYIGKYIFEELKRENIAADAVWTDHETRRTSTLILSGKMQTTVILESGSGVDLETGDRFVDMIHSYSSQASYLVLTGSLPPGLPARYYASVMQAVKDTPGLIVCLDCEGETLRLAVEHNPQVIKVNSKEFQVSFTGGRPWEIGDACSVYTRLKAGGLELLVITDGPRGAYIFSADQPPFKVVTPVSKWVNTAGAGDTFMAGLLVGFQRGLALQEATRLASAAAASKLQQVICGSLSVEDLEYFLPLTSLEYLPLPGN